MVSVKGVVAILVAAVACLAVIPQPAGSSVQQSVAADVLCAIKLDRPPGAEASQYLGLSGSGQFILPQVSAQVLVVEIFSMYCPICQREAPNVNRLHQLVEANPALKGKVKLLGVGIGNTPYEVDVFRGKFEVPFPLVADPDSDVQRSSRELFRTPTFIVLKRTGAAAFGVSMVHVGKIENPEEFLRSIIEP